MSTLVDLRTKNLREQGKLPPLAKPGLAVPEAPQPAVPPEENKQEASTYPHIQIEEYQDRPISKNADSDISTYTPATNLSLPTVAELERCALPTTPDAARQFLASASVEALGRAPIYLKAPLGLDVLLVRLLGGYRAKKYKQDFIVRGIKLVLYEMYTGRALVEFGDGTDPSRAERSRGPEPARNTEGALADD